MSTDLYEDHDIQFTRYHAGVKGHSRIAIRVGDEMVSVPTAVFKMAAADLAVREAHECRESYRDAALATEP